tara:strand:- start:358 stop:534 length:177 start_codon:yes stop_codon:yes gene_type:complete
MPLKTGFGSADGSAGMDAVTHSRSPKRNSHLETTEEFLSIFKQLIRLALVIFIIVSSA